MNPLRKVARLFLKLPDMLKRGLIVLGVLILFAILFNLQIFDGFATEFWGIIFTYFIIEGVNKQQQIEQRKIDLVRQARSRSNNNSIDAIEEIRERNWLSSDGLCLLQAVNLSYVDLTNADLSQANLTNTNFSYSILKNTNFSNAKLTSAIFEETKIFSSEENPMSFENTIYLSNATFHKTELKSVRFNGAILKEASFVDVNFMQVIFNDADLQGSNFSFSKQMFDNESDESDEIRNRRAINDCKFCRADLTKSNFTNRIFDNVDFSGANLSEAILRNTRFKSVSMTDTTSLGISKTIGEIWDSLFNQYHNQDSDIFSLTYRKYIKSLFEKEILIKAVKQFGIMEITANVTIPITSAGNNMQERQLDNYTFKIELFQKNIPREQYQVPKLQKLSKSTSILTSDDNDQFDTYESEDQ